MTDEACPSLKPTWGKPRRVAYPELKFIGIIFPCKSYTSCRVAYPELKFIGIPTEMIHISVAVHDAGANSIWRETHGAQTSREYDIESSISYRFL